MSIKHKPTVDVVDLQQERIDREAADWFVQRSEGDHRDTDTAFFQWLASDERHGRTYDEIAAIYEDVALIAAADSQAGSSLDVPSAWRRRVAGGILAASLAALALFIAMPGTPSVSYRTGVGEIREVTLADGSVVTLGPQTQLEARIGNDGRDVEISGGAAFFAVAHDARRPFLIDAGGAEVRVVGTRFEVSRREHTTAVLVEQGRVEVKDRYALAVHVPKQVLQAGEAASVASAGRYIAMEAHMPELQQVAVQDVAAWRRGHLVYANKTLGEVVADLGRYYRPSVTLMDPALAGLRVTASFNVTDIPEFVTALGETFPVTVTRGDNGALVIARRK